MLNKKEAQHTLEILQNLSTDSVTIKNFNFFTFTIYVLDSPREYHVIDIPNRVMFEATSLSELRDKINKHYG